MSAPVLADLADFVARDVELGARNTLALPGRAAAFAELREVAQLGRLSGFAGPRLILGGGSNLVLGGDFDGLVIHVALPGRERLGEDDEAIYVRAGAGEDWSDFVAWTLAEGWPGLENLSLIPGTVGAAPIQNIGAYGLELAERFDSLSAFDLERGQWRVMTREDCRFGYRDSIFKQEGWQQEGRYVIGAVTFRLPKAWAPLTGYADLAAELDARGIATPGARDIAEAVIAVRRRKLPDPADLPNAGSFFHNPVVDAERAAQLKAEYPGLPVYAQADGSRKLAAGWLIEQAGWKGRDLGPVGMYEKQALVLVNRGGATGADVVALMRAVQHDVMERFGVELTSEPSFIRSARS